MRNLLSAVLAIGIVILTASTSFAQQYSNGYYSPNSYNYNNNYQTQPVYQPNQYSYNYNPGQYQASYPQYYNTQPVYDPYYQPGYQGSTMKSKINKAVKYGALGAGAGYLFSKKGARGKNTAIGAGLGAALGFLLDKY